MNPRLFLVPLAAMVLLLGACASTRTTKTPPPRDPAALAVYRGDSGERASLAAIVEAGAAADVVLIGENHGHPSGLAAAAEIWRDLLARSPGAVLSMEFFERDEQAGLDDYLTGLTTAEQMEKALRRTPGNYPPGHRAMVETAKGVGRPVIAANAPRVYVRAARLEGYDRLRALREEQRRLFRIPESEPSGRYREDFDRVMNGMNDPPTPMTPQRAAALDATFRSQWLWDWTMADSVARGLDQGTPVLHVVGRFHTDFDGGTAQALRRLRPGVRLITVSFVDADSSSLREVDRGRADFVIYAGEK